MPRAKPKSDVGTAMARLNGALFGFAADAPVLAVFETAEEWTSRYEALVADYAPVGAREEMLVERLATIWWRQRRLARAEAEYASAAIERVPEDFLRHPLKRPLPRSVAEADAHVEGAARCIRLMEGLPDNNALEAVSEVDAGFILDMCTGDDGAAALKEPLPGFDEGIGAVGDEWTPAMLRLALKGLAAHYKMTLGELLAEGITAARGNLAARAEERDAMLAEMDRMRRERMLPEAGMLHALTRCDHSLHRQSVQVMHELEAAQARRRGESAPLLRADLQLVGEQ